MFTNPSASCCWWATACTGMAGLAPRRSGHGAVAGGSSARSAGSTTGGVLRGATSATGQGGSGARQRRGPVSCCCLGREGRGVNGNEDETFAQATNKAPSGVFVDAVPPPPGGFDGKRLESHRGLCHRGVALFCPLKKNYFCPPPQHCLLPLFSLRRQSTHTVHKHGVRGQVYRESAIDTGYVSWTMSRARWDGPAQPDSRRRGLLDPPHPGGQKMRERSSNKQHEP